MTGIPWDGHEAFEQLEVLKTAGFSEAQAAAQIKATRLAINAYHQSTRKGIAIKGDMRDERSNIKDWRNENMSLRMEIQGLRADIRREANRIFRWYVAVMVAFAGVIIAAFAYFR